MQETGRTAHLPSSYGSSTLEEVPTLKSRRAASFDMAVIGTGLGAGAWTYVGYPVLMAVLARGRRREELDDANLPTITVLVPAFNEEAFIADKIRDCQALDYPITKMEILVVDDGSTDKTAFIAADEGAEVLSVPTRGGKANALNFGVANANGQIVVFSDANGSLNPGALRAIAREFADPNVAVVSGAKVPRGPGARGGGEKFYWRYENWLKENEGRLGITVGADGGIYAVRRTEFLPIPPGTLGDDLEVPLSALGRGWKVTHTSEARATEEVSLSVHDEFERRTRISAGVWQGLSRHRGLLSPDKGLLSVAFATHRGLRTVVVPIMIPLTVLASARAARHRRTARTLFILEAAVLGAAATGAVRDHRAVAVPFQFMLTNVAALRGGLRYARRAQSVNWKRSSRGNWTTESTSA